MPFIQSLSAECKAWQQTKWWEKRGGKSQAAAQWKTSGIDLMVLREGLHFDTKQ